MGELGNHEWNHPNAQGWLQSTELDLLVFPHLAARGCGERGLYQPGLVSLVTTCRLGVTSR